MAERRRQHHFIGGTCKHCGLELDSPGPRKCVLLDPPKSAVEKSHVENLADEWLDTFKRWKLPLYHVHANRLRLAIERDKAAEELVAKIDVQIERLEGVSTYLGAMRASEQRADNDTLDVEALARYITEKIGLHEINARLTAQRYADILTGKSE